MLTKLNDLQLDTVWRQILRKGKLRELRNDLELLAQSFALEDDRKSAQEVALRAQLDELEIQYFFFCLFVFVFVFLIIYIFTAASRWHLLNICAILTD
jgi:hypothetical protein